MKITNLINPEKPTKALSVKTLFTTCMAVLIGLSVSSCKKSHGGGTSSHEFIYVETNDFVNQNAILVYKNSGNGQLIQIPGSPFLTGGKGIANPTQGLGPDDSDTQIIITPDEQFLLAVNAGGNSIAVFKIQANGGLVPVSGSPFSSAGQNPVSLSYANDFIYVVNQGDNLVNGNAVKPNYVTLKLSVDGNLTFVSKLEVAAGSSPSQILMSNNKKFAFGADFLAFQLMPAQGSLRSFAVSSDTLRPVSGTPYNIPATGGALGLWQNPVANVLYVGFPVAGEVGIYNIDPATGALAFSSSIAAGPAVCWLRNTKDGNYLYALNSGENSISIYNTSNASSPSAITKFALKNPGPIYTAMGLSFTTSEDFSITFSPDEINLYVISQYTNPDLTLGKYNLLHILTKGSDGRLTEPVEPVQIPVANNVRPQGIAVLQKTSEY